MPRASSLAAEIEQAFGVQSELVEGTNGVFDVVVDGRTVFSKHDEQRFPEPGEIVDALRAMSAA
ncbi:MAG: Rdx family protein [Acidobacteria bacterium]|nr:Rdx family protein [Acidobacteriota bacterium]